MSDPVTKFSERQEKVMRQLLIVRRSLRRGEVSAEWIVMSVCTTLETACTDLLDDLLQTQAAQTNSQLERAMISSQRSEMKGSWHSRLQWLSKGFSKNLEKDTASELYAMIELRNAIAHNGASFTSRQLEKYHEFLRHRQVLELNFGVSFSGAKFCLNEGVGDSALDVGRRVATQIF